MGSASLISEVLFSSRDNFPSGLTSLINQRSSHKVTTTASKRRKLNSDAATAVSSDIYPILLYRKRIRLSFACSDPGDSNASSPEVNRSVPWYIKAIGTRSYIQQHGNRTFGNVLDAIETGDTADFHQSASASRNKEPLIFQYSTHNGILEEFSIDAPNKTTHLETLAVVVASLDYQKTTGKKLCQSQFSIIEASTNTCVVQLDVRWKDSILFADIPTHTKQFEYLKLLTPSLNPVRVSAWSPRDFYDSVYVPDKEDKIHERLEVSEIQSTLFAYQKRTVQWMLRREGVDIDGQALTTAPQTSTDVHGWMSMTSIDGNKIFVNPWLGIVTTHESLINGPYTQVSGGILAEEMGLGKTVEIIALLIRHQRDLALPASRLELDTESIKGTLIIAPESIISQWASEINLHAPALKTFLYPGIKQGGRGKERTLMAEIRQSDIVLCSYNTLAREVHFARDPPDRSTRNKKQLLKERLRSPLVQVHWWRCVLDECQMIQSGVSSAAEVALQIPRQHAWAVSGTPLRKDPGDVYGLLRFLQLFPYAWSPKVWSRLLDQYQDTFKELIKSITLRHTKHLVKDEIELPPQKRIVSTVSLTQIEAQHYSNNFDRMCQKIGLSGEGAPLRDDWDPDDPTVVEQMRTWLTRLRQLCLHPDVGSRNSRALGGRVQDVLRTVEDVLQVMIEQNEISLRTDERALFMSRLRRGQLLEGKQKVNEALQIWQGLLIKIQDCVKQSRSVLEEAEKGSNDPVEDWTPEKAALHSRLGQLRNRLRLALELEHMAQFFIGNAYFQIKDDKEITKPQSEDFTRLEKLEVEQYDAAKAIRVEMLSEPRQTALDLISEMDEKSPWHAKDRKLAESGFPNVEELGGLESNNLFDDLDDLVEQYNNLMRQVLEWRGKLVEILSKPLVDHAAEDIQGDEYEISTKEQDEAYARMDVFRTAVTDLSEILTGQVNALVKSDVSGWTRLAKDGKGHAPELMLELLKVRASLKPVDGLGSITGILSRLRSFKNNFRQADHRDSRRRIEAEIMEKVEKKYRAVFSDQQAVTSLLLRDVTSFIGVQNARLEFYRQLQHISDLVAPWPSENDPDDPQKVNTIELTEEQKDAIMRKKREQALPKLELEEARLETSIRKRTSQARYLEHLKTASTLGEERKCIICQDDQYEIGVLTECGHLFCKDCINAWLASHAKCPQCRATIKSRSELYQITYKPQELRMEVETTNDNSDNGDAGSSQEDSPRLTSIYSQISAEQLNEIKSIDLPHNFGTKIDFVARHLIWLRKSDPGSKTVVFSQFRRFCPDKLSQAFDRLGIRYAVVGGKIGVDRFKHDPNIECLLMHAGSQASGMNLVNASHVLLCEPLVNTALELQAIARVHRIGQHRPTTVWMYLIEGTVEKAIYDLSVERRLEHIGNQKKHRTSGTSTPKRTDEDIQAADAEDMNDKPLTTLLNKTKEGGEIVGTDDLWQCLFGNSRPQQGLPDLQVADDRNGDMAE